jgi:putative nucleotidyltransferase with HDIG domain
MKLDLEQLLDHQPALYQLIMKISQTSAKSDIRSYLVGGFVRDLLLGKKSKDLDVVVVGDGLAFADALQKTLRARTIVKYNEFGTAMIPLKDIDLEIVTARKEVYQYDSRKPKVQITNLDEDLKRRDFTINTLAVSVNEDTFGEFIDPFKGLRDIKEQRIVTPLDPRETFFEDPLRMLRAIRFAAQLSFHIETNTFEAIKKYAVRIQIISKERIRDEFLKIIASPKPSRGIDLIRESGLMTYLFPELIELRGVEVYGKHKHKDVYEHTLEALDNIAATSDDIMLRLAVLFHDIAKPRTKRFVEETGWTFHGHEEAGAKMFENIGRKLRLPVRDIKRIAKLIRLHLRPIAVAGEEVTDSAIRRMMVEIGDDIDALLSLCRADITSKNKDRVKRYLTNFEQVAQRIGEVEEKDKLRNFHSPLDGNAIMRMFNLRPGPEVGKIKNHIEEAILEGEILNNLDAAQEYAEKNKEKLIDLYLRND